MEKVIETFNALNEKARWLDEVMITIPHKHIVVASLADLREKSSEIKKLEAEIKTMMDAHAKEVKKEYDRTRKSISRVQMKMMYLLEELDQLPSVEVTLVDTSTQEMASPNNTLEIPSRPNASALGLSTPCSTHSNSPPSSLALVAIPKKKTKTVPVFNAVITSEDFAKVPRYMKGRMTLIDLQCFINNAFIQTLQKKYDLLSKNPTSLKGADLNLFYEFRKKLVEEKFITDADIVRTLAKAKLDKKDDRFIQMMRHLHLIREIRKASNICYIWLNE